jgi:CheY-like chemotaxis protein
LAIGKLKPGVTRSQAQVEFETINRRLAETYPGDARERGVRLASLHEHLVRNVRGLLCVFQGAALLVLLVAVCGCGCAALIFFFFCRAGICRCAIPSPPPRPKLVRAGDDADMLDLLQFSFLASGFTVFTAATAMEGLHRARQRLPDVIILDVLLPDLDGITVCEILRKQPSTASIPVLMLTALYKFGDRLILRSRLRLRSRPHQRQ